jgi:LacI family transcriptional regulator
MPRATIKDVAIQAGLSVSTVNRALHEPRKVREETLRAVLQAAEKVGFYGHGLIRQSLRVVRPKVRIGIQLLQANRGLYQDFNAALLQAARNISDHEVVIRIEHLSELTPQNVASGLQRLAQTADIVGVVSTEHPTVAAAIENLATRNVRTFALLSEVTARCNVGYVGHDYWKMGRTAGWALRNLCKTQGKLGILVGNHRYRCQETAESGCRSYFREHRSGLELLEARSTFESDAIAQEVTEELVQQTPDLAGLFVAGGGLPGVCEALRATGRGQDIVVVGIDLTDVTRAALLDGTINVLLSHPIQVMAQETIAAMIRAYDASPDYPPEVMSLPFEIYTAENL